MSVKVTDKVTSDGKAFQKMLEDLSRLEVRIGFQAGVATEENGADLCDVAAWNEFGTHNTPSRPFLRSSVDEHEAEITGFIKSLKTQIARGGVTAEEILKKFGVFQKGLIQETIKDGRFAPNAPSTVARKGSSHPLIDTGTMRASVNFVIEPKGSRD